MTDYACELVLTEEHRASPLVYLHPYNATVTKRGNNSHLYSQVESELDLHCNSSWGSMSHCSHPTLPCFPPSRAPTGSLASHISWGAEGLRGWGGRLGLVVPGSHLWRIGTGRWWVAHVSLESRPSQVFYIEWPDERILHMCYGFPISQESDLILCGQG